LNPASYYRYTTAETGRFLNHDDRVPEDTLSGAFRLTANVYESKYGTPFAECGCWYCECIREPMRSAFIPTLLRDKMRPPKGFDLKMIVKNGFPRDPIEGVHISNHSAVRFDMMSHDKGEGIQSWAQRRRTELERLDVEYAQVEMRYRQKREKKEKRKRDEA
jgi:hypothetical protein